jgi:ATP-dependent Clp protease ATP-binding subunit ClpB
MEENVHRRRIGQEEAVVSVCNAIRRNRAGLRTQNRMSEYQERHQVARLIGAPPDYIGYGEGGQLTEQIRRRPYSAVLLDEIEKAHPDVFNILLIDEIIVFHQLEKAHLRQIVDLVLSRPAVQLEERRITIEVSLEVRDFLVEVGFSPVYGARPLNREVERRIENPLSLAIIDGRFRDGDTVIVELSHDREMGFRKAPAKRKRRKSPPAASASASRR